MESEETSPKLYWDALKNHDWLYSYSSDPGVYRRGDREHGRLHALARSSPEHQKLWDGWLLHVGSLTSSGRAMEAPARPE